MDSNAQNAFDCIGEKSEAKAAEDLNWQAGVTAGPPKSAEGSNQESGVIDAARELAGIPSRSDCAWLRETPLPCRLARPSCLN